jgi:hypothetical protein
VVRRRAEPGQRLLVHGRRVPGVAVEGELGVPGSQFPHQPVPVDLSDHRRRGDGHRAQVGLHRRPHRPRASDVVMRPVEQHDVRFSRQLLQGPDRRRPQRGRHAERVDLLVTGLTHGVRAHPVRQHPGQHLTPVTGQLLGIGEELRRLGETWPHNRRADHDRSRPRAAAHLVHAGHDRQPRCRELTLDVVAGRQRLRLVRARRLPTRRRGPRLLARPLAPRFWPRRIRSGLLRSQGQLLHCSIMPTTEASDRRAGGNPQGSSLDLMSSGDVPRTPDWQRVGL